MKNMKNVSRTYYWTVQILRYVFIILLCITIILPFLWMVSSSLKSSDNVFAYPIQWIPEKIYWDNFRKVFEKIPMLRYIWNSTKLTLIITTLRVLTSCLAAYAFAKLRFKGRDLIFLCYIAMMAVPWHSYLIPQFKMMSSLGLLDTHMALILMQYCDPFGVFLMRQFMLSVPNELCEAARIDGLGELGIFSRIVLPLCKSAICTIIIFSFTFVWNDYTGPMIYLSSNGMRTIQLGLKSFISDYSTEYALVMAGSVIAIIPVFAVFLKLQKYFIEGIATSGLKG